MPISASSYRQRRTQGTVWTAPSGAEIRVRMLDITDHAVIGVFPTDLQEMIYAAIERSNALRGDATDEDANPFAGLSGKEMIEREYEIGTTLCTLGWIEPQVVATVTDPETQISIDEVEARDRRAYMTYVFDGNAQEAQKLATFPGQSAGGVGVGPTVPAVRPDAILTHGDHSATGVERRDSV